MTGQQFAEPLLRLLGHCGAATLRQIANGPQPISARWVTEFARADGLITVDTLHLKGEGTRWVSLTPAGKRHVHEYLGIRPYLHRTRQALHDITLAGFYLRLPPACRATWQNPEELLAKLVVARKGRKAQAMAKQRSSYPDGIYRRCDGALVVVEIAGSSLSESQIQIKRDTAREQWGVSELVVVKAGIYSNDDL